MSEALVHITRNSLIESIHRGDLAVVDSDGNLVYSVGSPKNKVAFIRSSSKPIQAIPIIECGAADHYSLSEEELAIFCASHNGEERHLNTVRSVLKKIGLDESALQCGTHWSSHKPTADAMARQGLTPSQINCNCSGKHSGMLTLSQFMGWSISNYTEITHPVQQAMLKSMALFAGLEAEDICIGTDGCGVPVFGVSVYHMARAFAKLANPIGLPLPIAHAAKRITSAMMNHPFLVAGSNRLCTTLMSAGKGNVFGKSGADGVYCVGLPQLGLGLAVKIEDGNGRANGPVMIEALRQLGALDPEQLHALAHMHSPKNYNHRKDLVGESKAVFTLDVPQG
ncbi:MAG: asparaginase [Bacillota bacterium]|nr:asparaginase [Bacillota bacterium]